MVYSDVSSVLYATDLGCLATFFRWTGKSVCFILWILNYRIVHTIGNQQKFGAYAWCTSFLFIYFHCFVENVPQGCDAEIEELEHKLADYRDIIEQQEQMIQVGGGSVNYDNYY